MENNSTVLAGREFGNEIMIHTFIAWILTPENESYAKQNHSKAFSFCASYSYTVIRTSLVK